MSNDTKKRETLFTRILAAIAKSGEGLTADQIVEILNEGQPSEQQTIVKRIRPRLTDLKDEGKIEKRGVRRTPGHRRDSDVWVLTNV